ncbi:Hint domain-containing protein, partial [Rhodoblastus sp.]|uniref:Hint domain-containing protein n=1 Tax=Rhodoblastus sp. TaxID=1962975 RepID=UPI0035B10971
SQYDITICFMAGTLIRTPAGEVPVETLKRGDLVMTTDGSAKPVVWLGKQTVRSLFADPVRNWPIRVKAGALAHDAPARDLLVSPDHALLVGGMLIHAGALVNGASIVREATIPSVFVYYHVELDDHSLILAENTPAETFIDNVDRMNFDNWPEHEALFPDGRHIAELSSPRAKSRRQVPLTIRAALDDRARQLGFAAEFAEAV